MGKAMLGLILSAAVCTAPAAADPGVARILRELAAQPAPAVIVVPGSTIACSVASQPETRRLGFRQSHLVACGSLAGEVRGALLSPKGSVRCAVTGTIDFSSQCDTLVVCGTAFDACY